jgi:hypothetical protein
LRNIFRRGFSQAGYGDIYAYNVSYLGGGNRRISILRPARAKLARPYVKNKIQNKRGGIMAQVISAYSMPEVLGSVPSNATKE